MKHLFHGNLRNNIFITHKIDVIIDVIVKTSQSHSHAANGSIQNFDNDYDVIFMCYKCNTT